MLAIAATLAIAARLALTARAASEPQGLGGAGVGYATFFEGFGLPYGGCGVPQAWTVDDAGKPLPFVALNTFADLAGKQPGMFAGGKNCGRWLRMTACLDCKGGSNDQWRACVKGGADGVANYTPDELSGTTFLYGYVADSCGDHNLWCRQSQYHVDVSAAYLRDYISAGKWGNRLVNWEFIEGPPAGWAFAEPLKFGWAQGAYLPHYPALIVHGTTRGVSRVTTAAGDAAMNGALGQMYVAPRAAVVDGKVTVRVFDAAGAEYGEYSVEFPCGGSCAAPTKAPATRVR